MATTDLTRTPSSGGNRKIWTFSAWLKRASKTDSNNSRIFSAGGATTDYTSWFMYAVEGTDATLQFQNRISSSTTSLKTNKKFRDVNGWYHLVIACDTTQATASNRIKIYINGVQETDFDSSYNTYPAQNADTFVNHTVEHNIGSADGAGYTPRYWAGLMSHINFCDGTQYAASDFGSTDSTTGEWRILTEPNVTYGTNGFHLKFENSGNMGLDSSGQTNNYSVSGGTMTQSLDTPSNVHATLNPLTNDGGGAKTYSNGNTTVVESADSWTTAHSTLGVTTGKWYFEGKVTYSNNQEAYLGACSQQTIQDRVNSSHYLGQTTGSVGYYTGNGSYYKGAGAVSYGSAVSGGDIVGVALDLDNNFIYFSINGTWQNSGDPTSGSSGTNGISLPSGMTSGDNIFLSVSPNQSTINCNFGNGFFGTTAISSAGSNGNGSLFEYDVPSGYYALNTKNINTYG